MASSIEGVDEAAFDGIGCVLAAMPSLGPAGRAWTHLGFKLTKPYKWMGCLASDLVLSGLRIRFVAPDPRAGTTGLLSTKIEDRLIRGAGLLGWTWMTGENPIELPDVVPADPGERCNAYVLPPELSPGVVTLYDHELSAPQPREIKSHPNGIGRLDRVVVSTDNADRTAGTYQQHFPLKDAGRVNSGRIHLFTEAGSTQIEFVGPIDATDSESFVNPWGLVFHSNDLDKTIRTLARSNIELPDPVADPKGGRITALSMQLGGIGIAFIGD